ncbi:MAG: hypothetical protein WBB37_09810 [bacterium]
MLFVNYTREDAEIFGIFTDFVVADPLGLSSGRRLGLLKLIIVEQARPLHYAPCNLKKVKRNHL